MKLSIFSGCCSRQHSGAGKPEGFAQGRHRQAVRRGLDPEDEAVALPGRGQEEDERAELSPGEAGE